MSTHPIPRPIRRRPAGTGRTMLLAIAFAAALPAGLAAQHFAADEDLDVMLHYLVEDGATPGIVLGIIEADGSTRILVSGTGGPDTRPLGPRSVFEIGSINKTFTGTLLADMVARGEVALEDPISKYLPEGVRAPSANGMEITLLHLATHRSGLPRLPDNHTPSDPENPYADYTVDELYEFLSSHELRREPGAEPEYSNLGVGLLGHLLARAAGTSYRELLRERILDPLGMDMTGYALEGDIAEWMTKGHEDGEVAAYWFGTEAIDGAGGLRSNLDDMLTYLDANLGPPENDLERAMRAAHEFQVPVEGPLSIGLGWTRRAYEGRTIISHGGGTGGFSTMIAFDPDLGVGFVRLTNTREFPDDIGLDFLRRGPPLEIAEVEVPREILETYAGSYEMAPGQFMIVALEDDGTLTLKAGDNVRFRMYAESDSAFFLKRTPWRFTFTRNDAGEVVGVEADLEGNRRTGRRVR